MKIEDEEESGIEVPTTRLENEARRRVAKRLRRISRTKRRAESKSRPRPTITKKMSCPQRVAKCPKTEDVFDVAIIVTRRMAAHSNSR